MNRGRQNYLLTDGGWILVVKHNFHTTDVEGNGKRIYLQRKGVADGCAGEGLERGDQYWGINYTLPPRMKRQEQIEPMMQAWLGALKVLEAHLAPVGIWGRERG